MKGLIDWFIDNRVAANLLMLFVAAGGALTLLGLKQEVFPEADPDLIVVTVAYPGATPEEIEEGICIKIEEQVTGLDGVKRVNSTASENVGLVRIELYQDADRQSVLDDVKTRVDAISTFPADAEKPVIQDVESPKVVMNLMVSGKTDRKSLKRLTQEIRDELVALPELSRVEIANAREYEVSIEVSEDSLRRYGLTFDEVVAAVRQSSLNLSGGTVKARGGEIVLRTDTQAYVGEQFEGILLLRAPDGTRVSLGDVAEVVDGFEDVDQWSLLDGEPALSITVFRIGTESAPKVAEAVYDYLDKKRAELPEGIALTIGQNWADHLEQRLDLMLDNGAYGLALIFLILALFLRFRVALWVALGIPIAFAGALWLLPMTDVSINMLSLFGFIVVLGILVDDAIVVGENIYHHSRLGKPGPQAAKDGTKEVMLPVILAVLTTIAAFVPMLTLPGTMGKFARVIPFVVICALAFSLVESLLILPKHLSHMKPPGQSRGVVFPFSLWVGFNRMVARALDWWVAHVYRPVLGLALRWRYVTLAVAIAVLILTAGLIGGKYVRFSFFPPIAGDQVVATLTMPEGTPVEETEAVIRRIEEGVNELRAKYEADRPGSVIKSVRASVGTQPRMAEEQWDTGKGAPSGSHLGEVFVQLQPPETRGGVPAEDLMRDLRAFVGEVPRARELSFSVALTGLGAPINVQLASSDLASLRSASNWLKDRLATFEGTFDIADDLVPGKREFRLYVKPEAEALGITQAELARQVRQGFYGDEAQRIQRGRDDVKVMVRYPKDERRSLADLENMRIRVPGGGEVPFSRVATAVEGRAPASINRSDGSRVASVTADVDLAVANTNEIVDRLKGDVLPVLVREFPGVTWSFEGEQREQSETLGGLFRGAVLAGLLIYSLLALAFGSFVQPLIVLSAIPFGMVGAILGHWAMSTDLTLLSSIGLLAMAGVVVNDSMILVDFVNRSRRSGMSVREAIREAGPRRFRAVILTSLTTFAGLSPLLLETSVQAQFLIPMAISLSFGVMFSTVVTLLLVPALYQILEDLHIFGRSGEPAVSREDPELRTVPG